MRNIIVLILKIVLAICNNLNIKVSVFDNWQTIYIFLIIYISFHNSPRQGEQSAMADSQPKGAKLALSPTSSLQTETYQDSIDYYNFPIDDTYRPLQNK